MSSSSSAMPFHHFPAATTFIPKEEGVMGGLQVAKDEEMEMEMELSGASGSGHLDGLLNFAGVDDERDQKPQHSGHERADGGRQQLAASSTTPPKTNPSPPIKSTGDRGERGARGGMGESRPRGVPAAGDRGERGARGGMGESRPRGVPATGYVGSMEAEEFEDWMESTFQKHHKSVIRILIKSNVTVKTGTGFVVFTDKERSLVMTCNHTFDGFKPEEEKATIRLSGRNDEFPLVIEHADSIHDLLLFSVTGMSCPPLEFSDDDGVVYGSPVALLGYCSPELDLEGIREMALVKDPSVMPGNILGKPYTPFDFHEEITYSCQGTPGNSGSPVIINGKVIGVHISAAENFREAVSVKTVKFVMEKWLGLPHDGKYTINEMLEKFAAKITAKGKQKGV